MPSLAELAARDDRPVDDHIVHLDATWEDFERVLELRGERSVPRMAYLEGVLEIMSPSREHEGIRSWIGRLLEAYCDHAGIECSAYGAWTLKDPGERRGAEPDECYVFGCEARARPHLAIEIIWTSGRLDKLDIYRKLEVAEVWIWRRGKLQAHALRRDRYEPIDRSEVVPGIDLDALVTFLDRPTMSRAVKDYREALAGPSSK